MVLDKLSFRHLLEFIRRNRYLIAGTFLLFISLVFIRHQVVTDLRFSYSEALHHGILAGWSFDFLAALLPVIFSILLCGIFKTRPYVIWPILTTFVWASTFSNATYHRFFEGRLQWWIIRYYLTDVIDFGDSVGSLVLDWPIILSFLFFVLALFYVIRKSKTETSIMQENPLTWHRSLVYFLVLFCIEIGLVSLIEKTTKKETMISKQVFKSWWDDFMRSGSDLVPSNPSEALAEYRDYQKNSQTKNQTMSSQWPLISQFSPSFQSTVQHRRDLGLPLDQRIHVVLVFVESFRTFDLEHPEIGPAVFPNVRRMIKKHGIQFRQAYSSAGSAGMTVRGQFSTVCSALPNMLGPGTYVAHSGLRAVCLPRILKTNGYQTIWFHGLSRSYHNAGDFEETHGTDQFYDRSHFSKLQFEEEKALGKIPDKPFLKETLRLLIEHAKSPEPIYANILTFSSHHPFVEVESGKLPESIRKATEGNKEYRGFLSKFKYTDEALGEFIDGLFKSEMGSRTVIVLMADHGVTVRPHVPLTEVQLRELRYRIPLVFLTKNQTRPRMIDRPVHQVDVAPTIGTIAGIHGPVSWVGRNVFEHSGSPWLAWEESGIAYRTKNRACYTLFAKKSPDCWGVQGNQDPLFNSALPKITEDPKITRFFRKVILSNSKMITRNLILPENLQPN